MTKKPKNAKWQSLEFRTTCFVYDNEQNMVIYFVYIQNSDKADGMQFIQLSDELLAVL